MSLIPKSRLIKDSAKSPNTAARISTAASIIPTHHAPPSTKTVNETADTVPNTMDAARPSQVFFGLTPGASLFLPKIRPNRYPAESIRATVVTKAKTHH